MRAFVIMPFAPDFDEIYNLFIATTLTVSTAMVIIQSEVVAAKFIIHPCRQANYPVWRQLSPS